ncbi:MAG: HAMP domain-containing histidine kinase [Deltaproteobacteria bacterium]|nr:HAMP domain-containing histidine kinase [Deltaproteobacteria bacterium]
MIYVLCTALIAAGFVWWLLQESLRPLIELIRWAHLANNLQPLTPSGKCSKEIGEIYGLFNETLARLRCAQEQRVLSGQAVAFGNVCRQVAHDIRSPLAALEVATAGLAELPEEKRLLVRRATARIRDIANHLIEQGRMAILKTGAGGATTTLATPAGKEAVSIELLSSLIDPLVTEKRLQHRVHREVDIHAELGETSYGLFAAVQPTELKRVLSNLVNNAVEGIEGAGTVSVRLCPCGEQVGIEVQDTGKGIPPEILAQLTQRGVTFGKAGGSGLGLSHARERVEAWEGTLAITSVVGSGTTVTLRLPAAEPPPWFVPVLTLRDGMAVVVLDDDQSIHDLWDGRLTPLRHHLPHLTMYHVTTAEGTCAWQAHYGATASEVLYLFDYELIGQPSNGLALMEQLQIAPHAILVTSRYEEPAVREKCAALGVRLIPKGLAGFVPIQVETGDQRPLPMTGPVAITRRLDGADARLPAVAGAEAGHPMPDDDVASPPPGYRVLLIDDDAGIRLAWKMQQAVLGIDQLTPFPSMEACEQAQPDYPAYDFAFVDKQIPESVWRIDQVITHLQQAGVQHVIVASGESLEALQQDPACQGADGFAPEKIPDSLRPWGRKAT